MLHKVIQHMSTARIFELLHMDLMGPMQTESLRGKSYGFVYVDVFLDIHGYISSKKNQVPLMHMKLYF